MSEIRNLTRNGETFYPLTHEKAVIGMDEFKETITEQIENYRPIEITGDVVNAPDEEDITADSNNLLKFKNRNNLYGLGKVILRRGSSFASQVTQSNTIYVIQYNFDLENGRVNIPNGSILLFEGGTLSNGTLVCADLYDVRLVYYQDISVILNGVTLEGNFIYKACDKDTVRQILVDNSSITKDANDVLSVKTNGIQNVHLNSNVVDNSSVALDSNNKISIKDGGVTGSKLNSGVVNTDDLSIVNNKIQLSNRGTTDGMGKIILRKDQSFASQLTQTNTIYVIRYNFTLTGNVTIPANCILEFDGGSVSGAYTITGNNTGIKAGLIKILNTDVTLSGSWNINYAYPQWFGIMPNDSTKDSSSFLKMMCSLSINTYWCNGYWYFSPTIINGAHGFSIIGESQLRTIFRLFNPTGNASYIIKFGGKEDFTEFLDSDPDYHTYYTTHFTISGIYFYEQKNELVNYNPNDGDLKYAAVIFDACVEGTVNLEFNCYDPAIYIRTCWEMMFEKLYLYYGGRDNDNFGIPKMVIGSAPRGSSVNSNTFIDIKGEALNGPVIKTMPNSKFIHSIINNFFYEGSTIVSNNYPNTISSDNFTFNLNDYIKNSNYDVYNIMDYIDGKIDISIGNINLDGDGIYNTTSEDKPLIRTIFGINTNNFITVGNIDIVQTAINGFIYMKAANNAEGRVNIGGFISHSSKNTLFGYNNSLILLSDNYIYCNINSLMPLNIFNFRAEYSVIKDSDIINIVKLNKFYDNDNLSDVLYNGVNNLYRYSNVRPVSNNAFYFNNKIALFNSKVVFKLPRVSASFTITFYLRNSASSLDNTIIQETKPTSSGEGWYQDVPVTITSLGEEYSMVKATIISHADGLTMLSKIDKAFLVEGFIVTLNEN